MQAADLAFHVTVKDSLDGTVSVFRIKDAFLNYASSDGLMTTLKDLCRERTARGARAFVVDLSAVTVMDSCGLSMLIAMKRTAGQSGARFTLFGLSPMVRRLFAITKLDNVFEIHDDERAALAALAA